MTQAKSEPAWVGARGIDCVTRIDATHAQAFKKAGVDFAVRYLGSIMPDELDGILSSGLAFMPVTYGNQWDGSKAVAQCRALNLPANTTVWLDVEGTGVYKMDPADLIQRIDAWAGAVIAAGFQPGLYVGAPQPLTSAELYSLKCVRYWHGQGRCVDRNNVLAEPRCGWCMQQLYPTQTCAGIPVDFDFIGADYEGRMPNWMTL